MPHRTYLPHALPDEHIILLLRRHWFVLFSRLLLWFIGGALPVGVTLLLPQAVAAVAQHPVGYPAAVIGVSVYSLYLWLFAFHDFVDYWLDVWIVTNERILNIEQNALFSRVTSEQKLDRIQDVTAEVSGVFPTFLHYGDVHIQTAGEQARFVFEQVPDPTAVARKITMLAESKRQAEAGVGARQPPAAAVR